MERTTPTLVIGDKYKVHIYPSQKTFDGSYLTKTDDGRTHIFIGNLEGNRGYALVSNHWINQLGDGTITHLDISSFAIHFVPQNKVETLRSSNPEFLKAIKLESRV